MTKKAKKWIRFRVTAVSILFIVLFVGLLSRALQLQVISGKTLKALAEKQHTKNLVLYPERKMILDRNGQKLAVTVEADSIYADPSKITEPRSVSRDLARACNADRREVEKDLSKRGSFCWIARQVSPNQKQQVEALNIDGVHVIREPKRFYPHKDLACHILGFAGVDSTGLEGLELEYEKYLKSIPRKVLWGRDARGKRIYLGDNDSEKLMPGEDTGCHLILTIDSRIQYMVELRLKEAVELKEAKGGTAIVMDTCTGEILALANYPSFNPNTFTKYSPELLRNRAVTDCFDPGSVFKPFVVAAALEEGVVSESDTIDCENGSYIVGDRVIHEAQYKKHKKLLLPDVLKYSSNIGAVKVAEKLGKKRLYEYMQAFGFGSKTEIDLPGEVGGIVRDPGNWRPVDFATMAFGQGISVTAIQLVTAISAIANKGILMKPHLVKGLVDKEGKVIKEFHPTAVKRVISPVTADRITSILTNVVEGDDGTGKRAQIANVSVAGKTGTSQKFDRALQKYSSKKVITSFIGFFPADNPRITVYVMLDEPKKDRWGGMAAAPVFRDISEQILTCFNKDIELKRVADRGIEREMKIIEVSASGNFYGADNEIRRIGLNSPVPDFTGMSIREVIRAAHDLNISIRTAGNGWAVNQTVIPGKDNEETCITVFFNNEIR
ncbi:MAG: penicillin-binding transpeptidase domain-containing protein [Syntrophales bacterium]|jgi:cell division protein FtsI (penicillin-binding protein 3)|nr:penicillin-binding transpeptidase domain-containing protein [Syntrophales bacterium]MDY0043061.1 penicillin-binding transpeptidase domain-containing protein [Syntrophales bacterium]